MSASCIQMTLIMPHWPGAGTSKNNSYFVQIPEERQQMGVSFDIKMTRNSRMQKSCVGLKTIAFNYWNTTPYKVQHPRFTTAGLLCTEACVLINCWFPVLAAAHKQHCRFCMSYRMDRATYEWDMTCATLVRVVVPLYNNVAPLHLTTAD